MRGCRRTGLAPLALRQPLAGRCACSRPAWQRLRSSRQHWAQTCMRAQISHTQSSLLTPTSIPEMPFVQQCHAVRREHCIKIAGVMSLGASRFQRAAPPMGQLGQGAPEAGLFRLGCHVCRLCLNRLLCCPLRAAGAAVPLAQRLLLRWRSFRQEGMASICVCSSGSPRVGIGDVSRWSQPRQGSCPFGRLGHEAVRLHVCFAICTRSAARLYHL